MTVIASGNLDIRSRIEKGQRVIDDYNRNSGLDEQICLIVTIKNSVATIGSRPPYVEDIDDEQ